MAQRGRLQLRKGSRPSSSVCACAFTAAAIRRAPATPLAIGRRRSISGRGRVLFSQDPEDPQSLCRDPSRSSAADRAVQL